jgi:hypothetical protein
MDFSVFSFEFSNQVVASFIYFLEEALPFGVSMPLTGQLVQDAWGGARLAAGCGSYVHPGQFPPVTCLSRVGIMTVKSATRRAGARDAQRR